MKGTIRLIAIAVALISPACGGTPEGPVTPTTPSNVLAVAGTYPTRAALIADRNTCGAVTVQDNATTVTHTAGASEISLTHAGSTYRGTIDNSGRFSTPAATFAFPDGEYTISIAGQFSTAGFSATVELTRRAATTCSYAVGWVGTKSGSPNTIPG
jgi:hypothetical protein